MEHEWTPYILIVQLVLLSQPKPSSIIERDGDHSDPQRDEVPCRGESNGNFLTHALDRVTSNLTSHASRRRKKRRKERNYTPNAHPKWRRIILYYAPRKPSSLETFTALPPCQDSNQTHEKTTKQKKKPRRRLQKQGNKTAGRLCPLAVYQMVPRASKPWFPQRCLSTDELS